MMKFKCKQNSKYGNAHTMMSMLSFVYLVMFLWVIGGGQQQVHAEETAKYWIDVSPGDHVGLAALNWGRGKQIYSLAWSNYDTEEALDLFNHGKYPQMRMQSINALISYHEVFNDFHLVLGTGLSYVSGEIKTEEETRDSVFLPERHYIATEKVNRFALPLTMKLMWSPIKGVGFGIHGGVNVNSAKAYIETGLLLSIGKFN